MPTTAYIAYDLKNEFILILKMTVRRGTGNLRTKSRTAKRKILNSSFLKLVYSRKYKPCANTAFDILVFHRIIAPFPIVNTVNSITSP